MVESRRLKSTTIHQVFFNVLSVTEENGMVIVKTHEEYTVHYVTSRKDSQSSKDKTYTLKPVGDTYVITAIAVTAGN